MPRPLSQGMSGEDVRNLQGLLNYHLTGVLSPLARDGIFGPKTLAAVKAAQLRARIAGDGLVGPKTRAALVNLGMVTGAAALDHKGQPVGPAARLALLARPGFNRLPPSALVGDPAPPPPTPPPAFPNLNLNPKVQLQSVTVQVGNTFSWRAYAPSPFVVGAQSSFLFRLGPLPPFLLSPSVQFSQNGIRSANGDFTGQGAIQISPPDPIQLGVFKLGAAGEIDLLSPFVQGFVQRNGGVPGGSAPQGGFSVGNQFIWQVLDGKLQAVITGQAVFGWDLVTGQGQRVAPQVGAALQLDLLKIFGANK